MAHGGFQVVEGVGVEVLCKGARRDPFVAVSRVACPLDQELLAATCVAGVEKRFDVEVLLAIDDVCRRGVANGVGCSGAVVGFEVRDVDGGVPAEMGG